MLKIQVLSDRQEVRDKIQLALGQSQDCYEPDYFNSLESFWSGRSSGSQALFIFDEELLDIKSTDFEKNFRNLKSPGLIITGSNFQNTKKSLEIFNTEGNLFYVELDELSESFTSLFVDFGSVKNLFNQLSQKVMTIQSRQSSLVHDMKNTAMIIGGKVAKIYHCVQTQKIEDPWIQEILVDCEKVRQMVDRVNYITNDISVTSGGKQLQNVESPAAEKVQLLDTIWAAIEESLATGNFGHIEIIEKVDPSLQIRCVKDPFIRCLINLIKNACEAISHHEKPWIQIDVNRFDSDLVIEVTDSGEGVEDPDHIFEPFYTTKEEGTGLGLDSVRKYLATIGGIIRYAEEAENTCFEITIQNVFSK